MAMTCVAACVSLTRAGMTCHGGTPEGTALDGFVRLCFVGDVPGAGVLHKPSRTFVDARWMIGCASSDFRTRIDVVDVFVQEAELEDWTLVGVADA